MGNFLRAAQKMVDRRHDKNVTFIIRRFVAQRVGSYGDVESFVELCST